jgi:hypothetical protein
VTELFGGEEGLALISEPDQVHASLCDVGERQDRQLLTFAEVNESTKPVLLNRDQQRRLTTLLLDRSSYEDGVYGSVPDPEAKFVFRRGSQSVDVLVCVGAPAIMTFRDGTFVSLSVVRSRADLLAILVQVFHNNPRLSAMNPAMDFFGQDGFDILVGADFVEAHPAGPDTTTSQPIMVPKSVADRLAAVLSEPRTYDDGTFPEQGTPYVRLRFVKGGQDISVSLCADTKNIISESVESNGFQVTSHRSVACGFEELSRLIKPLLNSRIH